MPKALSLTAVSMSPRLPPFPQEGIQKREIGLANAAGMALLGGLCLYRGFQDAEK